MAGGADEYCTVRSHHFCATFRTTASRYLVAGCMTCAGSTGPFTGKPWVVKTALEAPRRMRLQDTPNRAKPTPNR